MSKWSSYCWLAVLPMAKYPMCYIHKCTGYSHTYVHFVSVFSLLYLLGYILHYGRFSRATGLILLKLPKWLQTATLLAGGAEKQERKGGKCCFCLWLRGVSSSSVVFVVSVTDSCGTSHRINTYRMSMKAVLLQKTIQFKFKYMHQSNRLYNEFYIS